MTGGGKAILFLGGEGKKIRHPPTLVGRGDNEGSFVYPSPQLIPGGAG